MSKTEFIKKFKEHLSKPKSDIVCKDYLNILANGVINDSVVKTANKIKELCYQKKI